VFQQRVVICVWFTVSGLCLTVALSASTAWAQENNVIQRQEATSELTEGLLDLVQEPDKKSEKPTDGAAGDAQSHTADDTQMQLKAEDVGLEQADLNEQTDNPLESIRQSMLIAAGFLRKGVTDEQTQQLQGDIVSRLDELIDQLEASEPSTQTSSGNSSQQDQQQQQQQSSQPSAEPESSGENQPPSDDSGQDRDSQENSGGSTAAENQPGLTGEKADVEVDLGDPRQLQQSLWGQLPERVRQQMQSRMVERFLPSYREQIEAYFQALLKTP
jgi:hypothetical protein